MVLSFLFPIKPQSAVMVNTELTVMTLGLIINGKLNTSPGGELCFDLVEPDPSFFVTDLFYHVEADPSNVVDANLIECSLDERAFNGVIEHALIDIRRCVHRGDDGYLLQPGQHGNQVAALHLVNDARKNNLVHESLHHCRHTHPPYRKYHDNMLSPSEFLHIFQHNRIYAFESLLTDTSRHRKCLQVLCPHHRVKFIPTQVHQFIFMFSGLQSADHGITYRTAETSLMRMVINYQCLHNTSFNLPRISARPLPD